MSSLTTKANPVAALQNRDAYSAIEAMKGQLMAALPTHLAQNRDRYARILVTTLRRTPKLMQCDPISLLGSIMQSAQLGLEPGTGQVHLVPFKNQVQMIIGYEGLIELARRAGVVIHPPRIVREGDTFDVDFGNIRSPVVHKPAMNDAPMTHVWCAAVIKDMDPIVEVMSKAQVDAVMRSTQSKGKYGPWKDHYESMAGKTCIRRLAKYLPKNAEMLIAEKVDGHTLTIDDVMSEPVVEWDGTVEEATNE